MVLIKEFGKDSKGTHYLKIYDKDMWRCDTYLVAVYRKKRIKNRRYDNRLITQMKGVKFLSLKNIKGITRSTLYRAKDFVRNELILKEL